MKSLIIIKYKIVWRVVLKVSPPFDDLNHFNIQNIIDFLLNLDFFLDKTQKYQTCKYILKLSYGEDIHNYRTQTRQFLCDFIFQTLQTIHRQITLVASRTSTALYSC